MKLPVLGALATAFAGQALVAPAPLFAQSTNPSEVVVFGIDPCPRATDDSIVVCKRYPEGMRYRMPEVYRQVGTPQQRNSWANKAKDLEKVGATGVGSCSAVGPGGFTGCLAQEINQSKREAKEAQQQDTAPQL